jgi:hypothetical protein
MTTAIATNDAAAAGDSFIDSGAFKIGRFEFTTTELKSSGGEISFEEWERLGEFIRLTNQASQWWWGDWLNMGEDGFGEKASQALEITRWDEETLRQYAWVCRKVPAVTRVTGVPFTHYRELAKLSEPEQKKWAEQVVSQQWSRRQLKIAMKDDKTEAQTQPCVLVRCKTEKDADEVAVWASESGYEVERAERKVTADS